ncbi:hypothetical protein [Seonamhaeicola sp.]|uniref:hypothetical protein n=1 Tax=Seonamhaeicola sp. TaxID=1912245 RepID=UPI00356B3BEB
MATTIAKTSIEYVSRMIRNDFDNTDWWNYQKLEELIQTAKSYGLEDLADEMENDLSC